MAKQVNLRTPLSPVRQHWMPTEQAIEQYLAYEERYGRGHALLACHAAFPLIVTPELVNLIGLNFLSDQAIDWVAEADFLLAFCHPIDTSEGLYQIDPGLREVMLTDLQESDYGIKRLYELADFLLAYGERYAERQRRPDIARIHQWIAWSYLHPQKVVDDMRAVLLAERTRGMDTIQPSTEQIHVATMIEVMRDTFEIGLPSLEKHYQELLETAQVVAHYWYRGKSAVSSASTQKHLLTSAAHQIKQIIQAEEERGRSSERPLNIQITGGTLAPESALVIAKRLGFEIVKRGHILLTYGSGGIDVAVVLGAYDACVSTSRDPIEHIKIFRPSSMPLPSISKGYFAIAGRDFSQCRDHVIEQSNVLILLSGGEGTFAVAYQARTQQKPIIPVGMTGGTAAELWQQLKDGTYNYARYNSKTIKDNLDRIGPYQHDEHELVKSVLNIIDSIQREVSTESLVKSSSIKTRVLFFAANPVSTTRLRLDIEVRGIAQSLQQSNNDNQFELIQNWATRPADISEALHKYHPQFVHFSCPGSTEGIILENNDGEAVLFAADEVSELLKQFSSIECVILNTDYSIKVAEAIVSDVNYAIGCPDAVFDRVCIEFSAGFYKALSANESVLTAFELGLQAVHMMDSSEEKLPKLLMKQGDITQRDLIHPPVSFSTAIPEMSLLFFAANPDDTVRIRLDWEAHEIDNALRHVEQSARFDLIYNWSTRFDDIAEALLKYRPDFIHFTGHGSATGEIVLEDNSGQSFLVSSEALAKVFELYSDVKCVVFNLAYSEGLARALAQHVDYAIGMNGAIGDTASVTFSASFYKALSHGISIPEAYELGRTSIQLAGIPEDTVPILVTRHNFTKEITN